MLKKGRKDSNKVLRPFLYLLFKCVLFILAAFLIYSYIAMPYRMSGNNMFPSIKDGDLCIFYRLSTMHVGDIVLYREEDVLHVGRVVARAGQNVDITDTEGLLIDGYAPAEELPYITSKSENGSVQYPITVPSDSYFILNDYREKTDDGREYGATDGKDVEGVLIYFMRRRGF